MELRKHFELEVLAEMMKTTLLRNKNENYYSGLVREMEAYQQRARRWLKIEAETTDLIKQN